MNVATFECDVIEMSKSLIYLNLVENWPKSNMFL